MPDIVECPKCNQRGLVHCRDDLYQCLLYDFKRDLSQPESKPTTPSSSEFIWILIVGLFVVLLAAGRESAPQAPQQQSPSPSSGLFYGQP